MNQKSNHIKSEDHEAYLASMKKLDQERDDFHKKLKQACPIFWRDGSPGGSFATPSVCSGWHDIIFECSCQIEKALTSLQGLYPVNMMPYPAQIKEKFGGLRFYYDTPCELPKEVLSEVEAAIQLAENKSYTICEYCGASDSKMRNQTPDGGNRWIKTLCDKCWNVEK